MDVNINLYGSKTHKWEFYSTDRYKVWVFDIWQSGILNKVKEFIKDENDEGKIIERIKNMITYWTQPLAVVIKTPIQFFAFSDHIQSYTLYYYISRNSCFITDQPNKVLDKRASLAESNVAAFMFTRYTFGNRTLVENLYQIPAGQYLRLDENGYELKNHFIFKIDAPKKVNTIERKSEFKKIILAVIQDLIDHANGKQLVLMFSGGYDSRLLLWALDYLKAPNVLLCSYGRPWQRDVLWAKQFAEFVPYDWRHIKINFRKMRRFYQSKEKDVFYQAIHKYSRKPYVMDMIALNELKQKKLVKEDAIFINGMCGGFISGAFLDKKLAVPISIGEGVDYIVQNHCVLWSRANTKKKVIQNLKDQIRTDLEDSPFDNGFSSDMYEWWVWRERLCKIMVLSATQFDWYGHKLSMPLWDKRIVNYFMSLPFELRLDQGFFRECINELKTSTGNKFTDAPHTIRERPNPLLKLRRLLEYSAHPRWFRYTKKQIKTSKSVANKFLGTSRLGKYNSNMGLSNALVIDDIINSHIGKK